MTLTLRGSIQNSHTQFSVREANQLCPKKPCNQARTSVRWRCHLPLALAKADIRPVMALRRLTILTFREPPGRAVGALRLLASREPHGRWVARILEHDMSAEGRTRELAIDMVLRLARAHIAH